MLKAALKTKALAGHVPFRHLPLAYLHSKDKDKFGNPIKGTAKVIVHPDPQRVRTVQREFELRARGYSYDEIRKRNLAEPGLVPDEIRRTYSRHAIEVRLKNPIYWGYFYLKDDPKRYEGKHELIIPAHILKAVEQINNGDFKGRSNIGVGEDIFRGWLTCDDPECGRLITYERKEKTLKSTGAAKVYHLYRCTNSRKVHDKKVYIGEEAIFEQFESVVQRFSITKEFATDITEALAEAMETQRKAIKRQMEGFRVALKELEGKEDIIYEHFVSGVLDKEAYQRQVNKVRAERTDYTHQLEQLTLEINDASNSALAKVFELAVDAELQWNLKNREERAEYLKRVLSNPRLKMRSLRYDLEKPFERLAKMKGTSNWRREVLNLRTDAIAWASA